jgi:hypothetical protein
MGRESRQSRRQRQRRDAERARKHQSTGSRTALVAGIAMAAVVIAVIAALVFSFGGQAASTAGAHATATAQAEYTPVAGVAYGPVRCSYNEMVAPGFYHVHAHLTILDRGKNVPVSPNIGYDLQHDCLTWAHTHNPSMGVIHIESPYKIIPTLGDFFKVWGQPLSSTQVASAKVTNGEQMKVFVDEKPYTGNPQDIKLKAHTDVEIEVGPPFVPPKKFNYYQFHPPL